MFKGDKKMSKYLVIAHYTAEGMKGILKEGGTARAAAVERLFASLGGKLESFYFDLGNCNSYITMHLPDNVSLTTAALVLAASGTVTICWTATSGSTSATARRTSFLNVTGAGARTISQR